MSRIEAGFFYYAGTFLGMYLVLFFGSAFEWYTPLMLVAIWVAIEFTVYAIIRAVINWRIRREIEKEVSA